MIFKQWQQVLGGTKTQTRRLVRKNDWMSSCGTEILTKTGRLRWGIGGIYAIQPGRGKKAVGRIRIIKIRHEWVQDISHEDIIAEGIYLKKRVDGERGWNGLDGKLYPRAKWAMEALWNSIHKKPGTRWADNPEVWVLTFELAGR